jgi:hypothetical protein
VRRDLVVAAERVRAAQQQLLGARVPAERRDGGQRERNGQTESEHQWRSRGSPMGFAQRAPSREGLGAERHIAAKLRCREAALFTL